MHACVPFAIPASHVFPHHGTHVGAQGNLPCSLLVRVLTASLRLRLPLPLQFFMALIFVNTIFLCMDYYNMPATLSTVGTCCIQPAS